MFGRAWRVGSIGGVEIRVDSSWALIAVLVVYSEWIRFIDPGTDLSDTAALLVGVFTSFLFFSSVLVHELAHAGMARAQGIPVSGITLFLFGGATSARVEEKGPIGEFLVTIVGPGSSFALGAVFWALSHSVGGPLAAGFADLARINVVLAIFNLIPGFPLDGGRILRSVIWRISGSLERATRVAAMAGQVVGVGMVALGIGEAVFRSSPGALWLAMIGWFLLQAARGAMRQQGVRGLLSSGVAGDAMRARPLAIPAAMSLSEALDAYLRGREDVRFPVVDGDHVVGVLTFEAARRIGRDDPLRPVRDAMLPPGPTAIVDVNEPLDAVVDRLGAEEAMVVDDGRLVGAISTLDIGRWLQHRPRV